VRQSRLTTHISSVCTMACQLWHDVFQTANYLDTASCHPVCRGPRGCPRITSTACRCLVRTLTQRQTLVTCPQTILSR
jgi:hypothetical protein